MLMLACSQTFNFNKTKISDEAERTWTQLQRISVFYESLDEL